MNNMECTKSWPPIDCGKMTQIADMTLQEKKKEVVGIRAEARHLLSIIPNDAKYDVDYDECSSLINNLSDDLDIIDTLTQQGETYIDEEGTVITTGIVI
jgi:hypothetical protein